MKQIDKEKRGQGDGENRRAFRPVALSPRPRFLVEICGSASWKSVDLLRGEAYHVRYASSTCVSFDGIAAT
jgi:hypothetical protein